jgi:hypothetical protein
MERTWSCLNGSRRHLHSCRPVLNLFHGSFYFWTTDADSEGLVDLIRVDAGLTADILHVANSAPYSRGSRVETLTEAVNRVGSREIYRIITNIIASPVLANSEQRGFARLDLWKHSLSAAVAAQALAMHLPNVEPEVAFTAGLLHDIGKVVLAQAVGPDYVAIMEETKASLTPVFARDLFQLRSLFHETICVRMRTVVLRSKSTGSLIWRWQESSRRNRLALFNRNTGIGRYACRLARLKSQGEPLPCRLAAR